MTNAMQQETNFMVSATVDLTNLERDLTMMAAKYEELLTALGHRYPDEVTYTSSAIGFAKSNISKLKRVCSDAANRRLQQLFGEENQNEL